MSDKVYAVIADVESTGKDPKVDQVVESAFLELPDTPLKFMKAELSDLVSHHAYHGHTAPMTLGALATHNITADKLEGLEPYVPSEVLPPMHYIIGHNVDFDRDMLDAMGASSICTLALARKYFPDIDSHTQSAVIYHLGRLTKKGEAWARDLVKEAHSADADVLNCARILKYIIYLISKEYQPVGGLTWADIHQICLEARIPKVMAFGKFKGQPVSEVSTGWANWYANCDSPPPDPYVLIALRKEGIIPYD